MATSSVGAPCRPQDGTLGCLASTCSRNTHASTPHFCRSLPLSHAGVLRLTISAGQLCTSSSSIVRRSCASLRPHDWSSKVRGLHALSRRAPVRCPASLIHKCICICTLDSNARTRARKPHVGQRLESEKVDCPSSMPRTSHSPQ